MIECGSDKIDVVGGHGKSVKLDMGYVSVSDASTNRPTVRYHVSDVSELLHPGGGVASIRANAIICIDDGGVASYVKSMWDGPVYCGDGSAAQALAGFDFTGREAGLYYAKFTEADDYVAGGHEPTKSFRGFVWEISHAICLLVRGGR